MNDVLICGGRWLVHFFDESEEIVVGEDEIFIYFVGFSAGFYLLERLEELLYCVHLGLDTPASDKLQNLILFNLVC